MVRVKTWNSITDQIKKVKFKFDRWVTDLLKNQFENISLKYYSESAIMLWESINSK